MLISDIVAQVAASKTLSDDDALAVRREVYRNGVIDAAEVDTLFALDEAAERRGPDWNALFVEALADYVVHRLQPAGTLSQTNADWLIARIERHGAVRTATGMALLVKVLERAASSPESLARYALLQVRNAVVDGAGPLARQAGARRGRVGACEADLLRRILCAVGGEGGIAVTRAEAEVLFEINDATSGAGNDPAWGDLFVKAVANMAMGASGFRPCAREATLAREAWLGEPAQGVADFIGRMFGSAKVALRRQDGEGGWAARNRACEADTALSEPATVGEAEWLARRIARDGAMDENEKALLRFIRDGSPDIHPSLASLIVRAA